MKFSLSFIKEFLDLGNIKPGLIAEKLTLAGVEITSLEKRGSDWSLEAEITSNRPDLLSIIGLSYEIGAIFRKKIKIPPLPRFSEPKLKLEIEIEDFKDCPLYVARLIRGVKVKDSPSWLKKKLQACGINPVNNVVDITNYCMLKWGQPLHAFDFDKIEEKIKVRRAENEKLLCIDGKERLLDKKVLIISDGKKPLALAGIMGGKNSEITPQTRDVLLEAAVFSPLRIREARQRLTLSTESSYRFERKVFPEYLERASQEAALLISHLAGGRLSGQRKKSRLYLSEPPKILFRPQRLHFYLGQNIGRKETVSLLRRLNFSLELKKENFLVRPPHFRTDVRIEEDLYEEVARLWGYERIESRLPHLKPEGKRGGLYEFKNLLRRNLLRYQFQEIVTYSIFSSQSIFFKETEDYITITNPLRKDEAFLRTHLWTGMVEVMKRNFYQKEREVRFFEIGEAFFKEDKFPKEETRLCLGIHSEQADSFYLFKVLVESFLKDLGIEGVEFKKEKENDFFSPFCKIENKRFLGVMGRLKTILSKKIDLENVSFAEFKVEALRKEFTPPNFKKINPFPWVTRDISLAFKKKGDFRRVVRLIKEIGGEFLRDMEVVERYKGEKIPSDYLGLTLRVYYQHKERTLESEEVDRVHFKIRNALACLEEVFLR